MHIEVKSAPRAAAGIAARSPARHRRTPGDRLLEALRALAGGKARVLGHAESGWASITFAGTRHVIELEFLGADAVEAGECFIAFLPEHEFTIPGQLVADAAVTEVDHRIDPPLMKVTCELLLLEEG